MPPLWTLPVIQTWTQNYDPLGNAVLSTLVAAVPVALLLYLLAVRKARAHRAAIYAFAVAIALAMAVFGMPAPLAAAAVAHSLVYAAIRIAWTLLAAVFVYEITVETGHFEIVKQSIGGITGDRRLQVLLIAFAFGALLEGAGGGGAPVAICGAMMAGLGFNPFQAAVLCLIANTAPVAWGGMGNPIRTLVAVTGLPEADLSAMVGRILPWTAMILPIWLVRTQVKKWRETAAVWPGLLVCGGGFAAMQFFWSNYMDSTLVDIVGGLATLGLLAVFFRAWQPRQIWRYPGEPPYQPAASGYSARTVARAWSPFVLLTALVVLWGLPPVKRVLDAASFKPPVPGLHLRVVRTPPVVAAATPEPALFDLALVSNVGNAVFLAGMLSGPLLGLSFLGTLRVFARTCRRMRFSMLAIVGMIGLGFITRYSGMDAVMGLALTHTGVLFPLFGTLIGWLGVALTGTDAGSNALFGSLQVITAQKLGISPVLMAAANSAGGVMGKMIDAQSIIVACAATGQEGREGDLFRAVMKHSVLLALIVGLIVTLYAYVLTAWIPSGHRFW
jgi:lactate permease